MFPERAEATREAEAQKRVAEERLRIAQDLHDTVAHRISVISLNAGVASNALEASPDKAREALGRIRSAARGVLGDIGELMRYLRQGQAEPDARAPQLGLAQLPALVERMVASGLRVDMHVDGNLEHVSGASDLVGYRVVQEGLTNAHKHGHAHQADLWLMVNPTTLTILVRNELRPAAVSEPAPTPGERAPGEQLGLTGLRERVGAAGGRVETHVVGNKFELLALLPLSPRGQL